MHRLSFACFIAALGTPYQSDACDQLAPLGGNLETLGDKAFPGSTAEGATLIGPGQVRAGGSGPTHMVAPGWTIDLLQVWIAELDVIENPRVPLLWFAIVFTVALVAARLGHRRIPWLFDPEVPWPVRPWFKSLAAITLVLLSAITIHTADALDFGGDSDHERRRHGRAAGDPPRRGELPTPIRSFPAPGYVA